MRASEEMGELKEQFDPNYTPQTIYNTAPKITPATEILERVSESPSSETLGFEEDIAFLEDPFFGANRLPAGSVTLAKEKFLGSGAFGKVCQGQWGERQVALKEIDIEHAQKNLKDSKGNPLSKETLEEALKWEVSCLSTLSHPNLVQFYGIYQQKNETYLVMEFCEGGSLQSALEKKSNLNWSVCWQWALEITQGLAYLHHRGVLHRDLHAKNILLDKYQRAYLADLGVAQVDALLQRSEAKVVAEGFQDQHFIAPEIYKHGVNSATAASDIYALGLVFWQLVTHGKKPRHLSQLSIPAGGCWQHEVIPADCPLAIKELILDCWQLDPAKRPSAEKIVERLDHLGAQFHSKPDWIKMCEKLDALIHPARTETLKYIAPYVTQHEVIEDLDAYWSRLENQGYEAKKSMELQEEVKVKNEQMLIGNPPLALTSTLEDFLQNSEVSTLVLLGEAGLGKTLSTYQLADKLLSNLWEYLRNPKGTVPYCPLLIRPMLSKWSYSELNGALSKAFSYLKLSLAEADLQKVRWLIIIDGYDECQIDMAPGSLAQQLDLQRFPNAKLIVTCRPNTVPTSELQERFALNDRLIIRHFLPFSVDQMLSYLQERLCWDSSTQTQYQQKFHHAYALRAVLRSPFVLSLLVQSWETVSQKDFNQLNRWQIYEGFVEHWINTHEFLLSNTLKKTLKGGYLTLLSSFNAFAADIAFNAFRQKSIFLDVKTVAEHSSQFQTWFNLKEQVVKDSQKNFVLRQKRLNEKPQRRALLNEQDYSQVMLWRLQQFEANCPLKNRTLSFGFTHKSFFEYFVAKRILQLKQSRQGLELLNYRSIQAEPEALQFIREGWLIYHPKVLQESLFEIIEFSKQNFHVAQSAANAMTILNAAKISFSGRDLGGIRVPGADLTNAILDNTNLEDADLTGARLFGAWMHNTNFKNAQLKDVLFGEYPTLLPETVSMCCYSPDGQILAVAGDNIQLFDTSTRVLIRTLFRIAAEAPPKRLANRIYGLGDIPDFMTCISFSPDGKHLASGSGGGAVKLWDVNTGACLKTFKGHTDSIESVSFSPDGKFIASGSAGSDDEVKLRIWNVNTGTSLMLQGNRYIYSVNFSPDGELLASSSNHGIELWSVAKGTCLRKMTYNSKTFGVSFSHDGQIIAAGSKDNTIKLWNVKTGAPLITLKGHTSRISSTSFHPAELLLVSGSDDGTVKLWNTTTGLCLKTLEGHTSFIKSVSFSPDGKRVASGSSDKSVRFWDIGNLTYKQQMPEDRIRSITSISLPDGIHIATGNNDKTVKLWDAITGRCLKTFKGHTDSVTSVTFSSDGQLIASASGENKEVKLWDAFTGECLKTLDSPGDEVRFSSNGQLITSGYWGVTGVSFWDVRRDTPLGTLEWHTKDVDLISVSPDKQLVASGGRCGSVKLWDATGKHLKTLEGHTGEKVDTLCFSPDGQLLASVGDNKTIIMLWDVITGASLKKLEDGGEIQCISFSPKGQLLASGNKGGKVKLWDVMTGVCLKTLESHPSYLNSISFSPDGKLMASAGFTQRTIRLWDVATGACLKTLEANLEQEYVSFSPCGQHLVSGNSGGILLWDIVTGKCLKHLPKDDGSTMYSLAVSPDGQFIASGTLGSVKLFDTTTGACLKKPDGGLNVTFSADGQLITSKGRYGGMLAKLWDVATGICIKTLVWRGIDVKSVNSSADGQFFVSASQEPITSKGPINYNRPFVTGECLKTLEGSGPCFSFSAGERLIASGGGELGSMKFWDATGKYLRTLAGHTGEVNDIGISPDGRLLASVSNDKTLRLWDVATGSCLKILEGHSDKICSVSFSSDGRLLASVSDDKTVRLWDVATGSCLKILEGHSDKICSVSFSSDGQYLASGSKDNTIRLWNVNSTQDDFYLINLFYSPYFLSFVQNSSTFLISAHSGGHMCYWQVMNLNNKPYLQLLWSSAQNVLLAQHANIDGARGLSMENADLLKQRGAATETLTSNVQQFPEPPPIKTHLFDEMMVTPSFAGSEFVAEKSTSLSSQLLCSSAQSVLFAQHANIDGVQGLSMEKADLLKQRGAATETLTSNVQQFPEPPPMKTHLFDEMMVTPSFAGSEFVAEKSTSLSSASQLNSGSSDSTFLWQRSLQSSSDQNTFSVENKSPEKLSSNKQLIKTRRLGCKIS